MRLFIIMLCLLCSAHVLAQSVDPGGTGSSIRSSSAVAGGGLIVNLKVDRTKAYVNEQILVTLQIGAPAIAFNITGGTLSPENAEVVPLNRQQSAETIDGVPHQFTKTVYALFAREPGTLDIPSLSFKAMLPVSAGGQMFSKGNPTITASTSSLQVLIEPEPHADTDWFPAQGVDIESRWSADITALDAIRAGEPVTRHVMIKVRGQHPGAIPTLQHSVIENVRTYPDIPNLETQTAITGLNGVLTQSYAVVASEAGSVKMPPIDIHWWSINEHQWQIATLPAEEFRVAASTLVPSPANLFQKRIYQAVLACMSLSLAGLIAYCVILWRRNKQLLNEYRTEPRRLRTTERAAWSTLQRDLRNKDYIAVRRSIIGWANALWPAHDIRRLDQIQLLDRNAQRTLMQLDAHLYDDSTSTAPDLAVLHQQLNQVRKNSRKSAAAYGVLPDLYPDSTAGN